MAKRQKTDDVKFHTALFGFRKKDVVRYLAAMNACGMEERAEREESETALSVKKAELTQMNDKLRSLATEKIALVEAAESAKATAKIAENEKADVEQQLAAVIKEKEQALCDKEAEANARHAVEVRLAAAESEFESRLSTLCAAKDAEIEAVRREKDSCIASVKDAAEQEKAVLRLAHADEMLAADQLKEKELREQAQNLHEQTDSLAARMETIASEQEARRAELAALKAECDTLRADAERAQNALAEYKKQTGEWRAKAQRFDALRAKLPKFLHF